MQYLTLSQAAKETGVSKATLSKALKTGKISYVDKTDAGYKIDPAELFRVYPPKQDVNPSSEQSETHTQTSGEQGLFREMLERERQNAIALQDTINDLRERLDRAEDARQELTLRLEGKRKKLFGIF